MTHHTRTRRRTTNTTAALLAALVYGAGTSLTSAQCGAVNSLSVEYDADSCCFVIQMATDPYNSCAGVGTNLPVKAFANAPSGEVGSIDLGIVGGRGCDCCCCPAACGGCESTSTYCPQGLPAGTVVYFEAWFDVTSGQDGRCGNVGPVGLAYFPPDDADEDGTPDCVDGCPDDPLKIEPGDCGCGEVEGSCEDTPGTDPGGGSPAGPGGDGNCGGGGSGGGGGLSGLSTGSSCDDDDDDGGQCRVGPPNHSGLTDPIYLHSGEVYLNEIDLRIKGRGLDFVWGRRYRSQREPDSPQGFNFDCTYNIYLEQDGVDLILHNGWGRADRFTLDATTMTWTRPSFFEEIAALPNSSGFEVVYPNTGRWIFHPIDGSQTAGKISAIVDRNGNQLTFGYDAATGTLTTITDTLGRDILIAYNTDGLIESVTDFCGRSVSYAYYDGVEPGGSLGDLKSVTTPAVIGTPRANDFPNGKTTVYTYTTGFADERLNHNLISITDPRGNTFVVNEYHPTDDPTDPNFDRVIRQTWGDIGDIIDLVYVPTMPSADNNQAVTMTIMNDRRGHVREMLFDGDNRLVVQREYTGAADPDTPTDEIANRPTNPLRATDPAFYETRWEYNADSLVTRIVHPNLNEEVFVYDDANPDPRMRGNLIEHQHHPGPLGGDQFVITERFEYDDLGGCCGRNFVTKHWDGRGNLTEHSYDTEGNRIQTIHRVDSIVEDFRYNEFGQLTKHIHPDNGSGCRRVDVFTYYDAGPQFGYLREQIIDADDPEACPGPHFNLTTLFEYDDRGNLARRIDPRGNPTDFLFNELDQVIREVARPIDLTAPDSTPISVRYERDYFYDANDNLVRVDVQNIDEHGQPYPNAYLSTIHEYEILNNRTRTCQEVGVWVESPLPDLFCAPLPSDQFIITEFAYDENRNQTEVRLGEATNGTDLFNIVRTQYDERDLAYRTIRAPGSSDQSSSQFDYDANRNMTAVHNGLEDPNGAHVATRLYDGYDRMIESQDAMGNVTLQAFDANGNVIIRRIEGALSDTDPGSTANVRLHSKLFGYDEMDRLTDDIAFFFDAQTQQPIDDGKVITQFEYTDASQIREVIDDNNHSTLTEYDTALRRATVTDAKGNTVDFDYDTNSNITAMTSTELSDLGTPPQLFTTSFEYDALDRQTATIDNIGNRNESSYDSRGNLTKTVDALDNVIRYEYDGLDRLTATRREMTEDGTGATPMIAGADGEIITRQAWDDSSRLISQTDDNDHATLYRYDALNRRTELEYADGTVHISEFDVHDNETRRTDPNGTVISQLYDDLDRLTDVTVETFGEGVSQDTTFETYRHDGLSRLVYTEDDDSVVTRSYDSMSRMTTEVQNGQPVVSEYDGVGNMIRCIYPSGRVIATEYDELDRKKLIRDGDAGPMIAEYFYFGPDRVERRLYGNGTQTDYAYNGITGIPNESDDFGVKRIIATVHTSGSETIDARSYTWDPMGNKTSRSDDRTGGPELTHTYAYDSAYRLVQTVVTNALGSVLRNTEYQLDGVQNRTRVDGGLNPGDYLSSSVHQYTETPINGGDTRDYDANGNLITIRQECLCEVDGDTSEVSITDLLTYLALWFDGDAEAELTGDIPAAIGILDLLTFLSCWFGPCETSEQSLSYDFRDRLTQTTPAGSPMVRYSYDNLTRRTEKHIPDFGDTTTYLYDPTWHVCEEQSGLIGTMTYVYGSTVDECLQSMLTDNQAVVLIHYLHGDDLNSTVALTSENGTVDIRLEYDDYGVLVDPSALAPAGLGSAVAGSPYLFTGRRLDAETGWYLYRTRYMDPTAGQFLTRDTVGTWVDPLNLGNGRAYVGNGPASYVDPSGRFASCVAAAWGIEKLTRHRFKDHPGKDVFQHCYASCLLARHDIGCSVVAGLAVEAIDLILAELSLPGGHGVGEAIKDMGSNKAGWLCGLKFWQSCQCCCESR